MTPERYQRINDVLDRRQPDLTVLLEKVHKPHNLSAILRTCDAVGVHEAHTVTPDRVFRRNRTTSSGSAKWIIGHAWETVAEAATHLKQRGFRLYAAHLSDRAVDFRDIDYTKPTALLFGTEKFGVSDTALELADGEITIPMLGMVPSLNVSVAAATILYEAQRQRGSAGLYRQRRLDPETCRRALFEWGHPAVAEHHARAGLPVPELDEHGDIIST